MLKKFEFLGVFGAAEKIQAKVESWEKSNSCWKLINTYFWMSLVLKHFEPLFDMFDRPNSKVVHAPHLPILYFPLMCTVIHHFLSIWSSHQAALCMLTSPCVSPAYPGPAHCFSVHTGCAWYSAQQAMAIGHVLAKKSGEFCMFGDDKNPAGTTQIGCCTVHRCFNFADYYIIDSS